MVDTKKLIKEFDSADLFLRNRAGCTPAPLNEYDIMLLKDTAKACDDAARFLEKSTIVPYNVGDVLYYINRHTGEVETDTVKFITVTKDGAKPILEHHNIRFWKYYTFGVNTFWTEAEAIEAKNKMEK
jgi:hypothetical protein